MLHIEAECQPFLRIKPSPLRFAPIDVVLQIFSNVVLSHFFPILYYIIIVYHLLLKVNSFLKVFSDIACDVVVNHPIDFRISQASLLKIF